MMHSKSPFKIAGVAWAADSSLYSAAQDGKLIHGNAFVIVA
jgi:hypothetical protein